MTLYTVSQQLLQGITRSKVRSYSRPLLKRCSWYCSSRALCSHKDSDISLKVQYLILCTLTHEMQPIFPSSVSAYTQNPKVQKLIKTVSAKDLRPKENLIALFLDLDISILGAEEDKYNTYAKQIRQEYSSYSWDAYCKGRSKVMTSFLQRERIFFTTHFREKYEQHARRNIQRELNSLQNGDEKVYPGIYSNVN